LKNKYKSVLLRGFAATTLDSATGAQNDGDLRDFNDFAGD